jgi:adenylosuccinate synthase
VKPERCAVVVVDLGFGDAGKGLVTDFLVRTLPAHTVIRFNGGAQAGHNVVTPEGRHHTFSQIGAGAFVPGTSTFLARDFVLHPTAMLVEAEQLEAAGVRDPLASVVVSESALVVTPFHQAAGRLRELGRGADAHGSCGVGVGEAKRDACAGMEILRVGDLANSSHLRLMLGRLQEAKRVEAEAFGRNAFGPRADDERRLLHDPWVIDAWMGRVLEWTRRARIVRDEHLREILDRPGAVVFEGAQGVLLDEVYGFHPYTTWSDCTPRGALGLLAEQSYAGDAVRMGVLRAFAIRHGPGPLPTEDVSLGSRLPEAHNDAGPWQGPVRLGWPDEILCRYAVDACGGIDALALTHLDQVGSVDSYRYANRYRGISDRPGLFAVDDQHRTRAILTRPRPDLEHQALLARALAKVEPEYVTLAASSIVDAFGSWCCAPVRLASRGPTAQHVEARHGPTL